MIYNYRKHLVDSSKPLKECLQILNELGFDPILFVIDSEGRLIGSLTDGDVRRGLLKNLAIENSIIQFLQPNPRFIQRGQYTLHNLIKLREKGLNVLPVINSLGVVVNVINFRYIKSYLPVDAVIMAGGRGERLKPLTDTIPKPLLVVGDKPILKHNIDRLISFGVDDFWISVKYLSEQIEDYLKDGSDLGVRIKYIKEDNALGTIGSVSLIPSFEHDYILITNSDILTNLDYEKFFLDFIDSESDFAVATIPYNVNVPYAILETKDNLIQSFREKPTYTYFANAGIYLIKRELCSKIPKNQFYNATDLLEYLLENQYKVSSFPLRGYWLDIGKHDDYIKAQADVEFITF
jgi:dTDP-glucose pyrophosphorylase